MLSPTYSLMHAYMHKDGKKILVVLETPGWVPGLFGKKPRIVEYLGGGVVWYELPACRRCDTYMECVLREFEVYWDHHHAN